MILSEQSDERLVSLARNNKKEAIDILLKRYTPLIYKMASSYLSLIHI